MNSDKRMRRDSDSLLTHYLARTISVRITPLVAKTSITPMQVTIFGLILGLFASWTASRSGLASGFLGAVFLEISHILDCVDGELARITNRGNRFAAAMDPITDRIKDMAILFVALIHSVKSSIFHWPHPIIYYFSFFSFGSWMIYMYIVDSFLNPTLKGIKTPPKLYLGLYDLFIYGAILFLVAGIFDYFMVYVICISFPGIIIQLLRLRRAMRY